MIYRQLAAVVAVLCLAGPALADWTYRTPTRAGDVGDARVSVGNRTLSVGCGSDGVVAVTIEPGVPSLGATATDLRVGFVFDNNSASRIDLPMVCLAQGCYRGEVPGRGIDEEATALVTRLQRGLTLQVYFRDREMGDVTLRGSNAAILKLKAAAPNCVGL